MLTISGRVLSEHEVTEFMPVIRLFHRTIGAATFRRDAMSQTVVNSRSPTGDQGLLRNLSTDQLARPEFVSCPAGLTAECFVCVAHHCAPQTVLQRFISSFCA